MHSLGTVAPALCSEAHLADQLHTKGYLRQMRCVSEDTLKALEIIPQHDKNPLIILMADHGSVWRKSFTSGEKTVNPMNSFKILQAFRCPEQLEKADSYNWGVYFRLQNYDKPDGMPYEGEV